MINENQIHSKKKTIGIFFGDGSIKISAGVSKDGSKDEYPVVIYLTDEASNPQPIGSDDGVMKISDEINRKTATLFFRNREGLDVLLKHLIEARSYFADPDFFTEKLQGQLAEQSSL